MSKIPFIKAKHAQMKLIEGGGGGGGTSLVLIDMTVISPPTTTEFSVDEPISYDGMVLYAVYEDGYYRDVTQLATASIPEGTVYSDDFEGVSHFSYEENGVTVGADISITVVSSLSWATSKAARLIEAFAAAYAGDASAISTLAVGDIRKVVLQDGNTCHLILAKKNPTTAYNDSGASIGTAKFFVTMQEAYPYGQQPSSFFNILPEDLKPLFKNYKYTHYYATSDGTTSGHASTAMTLKAFIPTYTIYTNSYTTSYYGSVPLYPKPDYTIDCRKSAGGYYDSNAVDTSKDVFTQTNRAFRNILNPSEYINMIYCTGHVESNKNSSYWYTHQQHYDFVTNKGISTKSSPGGYTYCMLI